MKKLILGISIIIILLGSVLPTFAEFQMAPIDAGEGATLGFIILDTKTGDIWMWSYFTHILSYEGRSCYGITAVKEKDGLIRYYPAIPAAEEIKRKK